MAEKHLRVAEVADMFHVSPKTIIRWAEDGKLPYVRTLGGHRRFPEAAVVRVRAGLEREAG